MSVWRLPQRLGRCYASQWVEGNREPCRIVMLRTEAEQPFIWNSGRVVKGLVDSPCWCHSPKQLNHGAILCLHSNQLQWAPHLPPLSWDCGVDRTFPMGRWSLPVLPCLLPWGWLPTKRNTPNHLCEATYSKGPGTHWPAKHSVLDEPQVDHSNGPSSPKQQRLTNLIRTLGFRKSAAQRTLGVEETLVPDW